jgi:hypothetical protein
MGYSFNRSRPAWQFKTGRFIVALFIERDSRYTYDGDDSDGETQAKLDSGEFVAFDSTVKVYLDGAEIAANHLCGSVYDADSVAEFWTAHRDPDPMNRNCTLMRAAYKGEGNPDARVSICHYFPGMVSEAIAEARDYVRDLSTPPYIREGA